MPGTACRFPIEACRRVIEACVHEALDPIRAPNLDARDRGRSRVQGIEPIRCERKMTKTSRKALRGTAVRGMRKAATLCTRMAVGLLLASAVTVAFVAAGLDLFPFRP
jgi:hypothetical protein